MEGRGGGGLCGTAAVTLPEVDARALPRTCLLRCWGGQGLRNQSSFLSGRRGVSRGTGRCEAIALASPFPHLFRMPGGRWLTGGFAAFFSLELLGREVPSEAPVVGSVGTLPRSP